MVRAPTAPRIQEKAPSAVRRAAALIVGHPNVVAVSDPRRDNSAGCFEVTAEIRLGLPRRWVAAGQSPNGVLAVEPARFIFPADYPIRAPEVHLRADFDRSLAHVQPGRADGPVVPCLVEEDLDELLHGGGLAAIVNQLVAWLENAALGRLIDPDQGWEPVRRDTLDHWIVADGHYIRGLAGRRERYYFMAFEYLKLARPGHRDDRRTDFFVHGEVRSERIAVNPEEFDKLFREWGSGTRVARGTSLSLVLTPGKLPSGKLHVADIYRPETVTDLAGLRERAAEYGCGRALEDAFSWLRRCAAGWTGSARPLAVILCARRPYPIIGESSNVELLPYVIDVTPPDICAAGGETPVFPAAHRETITPALLERFSGETSIPEGRDLVLVGCGSVGSKIAIHLARSGQAPRAVIDKRFLAPHNAARHALLPQTERMQVDWLGDKAEAVGTAIRGLGQGAKTFHEDVTRAVHDGGLRKKLFPRKTWAVVNSTGSVAVREALAAIPPMQMGARVVETSLFGSGAVGIMTAEGPGRNPNTADLIAEAYEQIRTDATLRDRVFSEDSPVNHESVGQGCGSPTMRISDARISLYAAAMAEGITRLRRDDLPESGGRLHLGAVAADGMAVSWSRIEVPAVHVVRIDDTDSWTVRVTERVHRKIVEDCASHPGVETGGIVVGRMSEAQQAFLVTDILPAADDSRRSAKEFVLGTRKVREMLDRYVASSQGALYCLGTWHRHLVESGPSERDRATANVLAEGRFAPSVVLIKTPSTYRALLAE